MRIKQKAFHPSLRHIILFVYSVRTNCHIYWRLDANSLIIRINIPSFLYKVRSQIMRYILYHEIENGEHWELDETAKTVWARSLICRIVKGCHRGNSRKPCHDKTNWSIWATLSDHSNETNPFWLDRNIVHWISHTKTKIWCVFWSNQMVFTYNCTK